MNSHTQIYFQTVVAGIVLLSLTACGQSDLIDLQERELDDARNASQAPLVGPANPAEPPDVGIDNPVQSSNSVDLSLYDLAFNDEFQGSSIDADKWNTRLTWGPDVSIFDQHQYYVDVQNSANFGYNPFSFDGETLTISAIETPDALRASANEQAWLSGTLTSANKFEFTYGYIEARVDLQPGRGVWPSFWMLSQEVEGLNPQLFVMEYDGSKPDSIFHNYNYQDIDGNLRSPGQWEVVQPGISEGFHTIGLEWSPQELLYYIDGEPRYRIVGENVSSQDMYLILNLAIGGVWPGAPDGTTAKPATLVVDYVRVYQLHQ